MGQAKLPPPATRTDEYLAHIAGQNDIIISLLQALVGPAAPAEEEVAETAVRKRPLPGDLPGRLQLETAGIIYLEDIPRTMKGLTAVSGIGQATAKRILAVIGDL